MDHITIAHLEGDQGVSDCLKGLPVQECLQLAQKIDPFKDFPGNSVILLKQNLWLHETPQIVFSQKGAVLFVTKNRTNFSHVRIEPQSSLPSRSLQLSATGQVFGSICLVWNQDVKQHIDTWFQTNVWLNGHMEILNWRSESIKLWGTLHIRGLGLNLTFPHQYQLQPTRKGRTTIILCPLIFVGSWERYGDWWY